VSRPVPDGYLGAEGYITSGPAPELVEAGYRLELADAPALHHGLGMADLAHMVALTEAGVVPAEASARLIAVLLELLDSRAGDFPYDVAYGDAVNSRERELERRLGTVAGWLPLGRTRREAGRIAFRLALRTGLLDLHDAVAGFAAALAMREKEHAATVWGDTTYLQPAQPSTFGHYLGGFAEEAVRHLERISLAYRWADRSPAGAGGVGGSRIPVDHRRLADLLGFEAVAANTRDAMWAVDGLTDAVTSATQCAITADRLAEDLEIFSSPQFGYVRLHPSLCRASALMPQKRNPYALAVIRGGAGTLIGRTAGILATQRTPSARTDNWLYAYGEVLGALGLARRLVALAGAAVRTLEVDRGALADSAGQGFTTATDLAERIVLDQHLDYRSAYRLVARATALATDAGRTALTVEDLADAAAQVLGERVPVSPDLLASMDPALVVATRTVAGGAAPERVREHARSVRSTAAAAEAWASAQRAKAAETKRLLVATARRLAGQ
jgi:argininosuccinate lyase